MEALPGGPFRFIAVDVETARSDPASICQLGFAFVDAAGRVHRRGGDVDPCCDFSPHNVAIHGIDAGRVRGAPRFDAAIAGLLPVLSAHVLVQHSGFDSRAIAAAAAACGMALPPLEWVDSLRIARRAWPEFRGNGGHGLGHLKHTLGIDFAHHDAIEDAYAAARVVLAAEARTGRGFMELAAPAQARPRRNPDGPHAGEVAVIGPGLSGARSALLRAAAEAGMELRTTVTARTTLAVVRDAGGVGPCRVRLAASARIAAGARLRLMSEAEFRALLGL